MITTLPETGPSALYAEVQQFYAEHMHALDDGDADAWALTFTEDAKFEAPNAPQPVAGRAALAAAVRHTARELAAAGEVHRHWHGMVAVYPQPDGSVSARCYALVIATPRGGEPRLHRACVCHDMLVHRDGRWLVHRRRVTRDDLP